MRCNIFCKGGNDHSRDEPKDRAKVGDIRLHDFVISSNKLELLRIREYADKVCHS